MITPEKKTIEDILKGSEIKFSIPSYQRNFDWGKVELQELMDDLKDIKESKDKNLFLGNLIFDTSEHSDYKIVDGQQRLTTISIVLIALREHAKKLNEKSLAAELQSFITISPSWSSEQGNKVSVSKNIKDIFEHISKNEWDGNFPNEIESKSVRRQVNKVKPIFNYIMDELLEYNKADLQNFIRAMLYSYVIVIKVENTEDVFSIFERTNARGLDLNIGDLLKNYIFSYGIEKYEEKWNEIISNAENSLQRMLKYFWISRKGYMQQSFLYKGLKKYGKDIGVDKFVDSLYAFSRYYKTAQSMDAEDVKDWLDEIGIKNIASNEDHYKRINRVFQALKLFRVTQAYPLIYSIFRSYKKVGKNSYKNLFKVLDSIEAYHFVNNVISGRIGNEIEKLYAEKSKQFFSERNFIKATEELVNELKKKRAHKDEFVSNFIDSMTYKNPIFINYIFDRINNLNAKGAQRIDIYCPEKSLKRRNYNIEHFLSQDKKKNDKYDDEDSEKIDNIGNLLVIPSHSNSQFGNKKPMEKIKILKGDPKHRGNLRYLDDFLKKYDSEFKKWNLKSIAKRSNDIANEGFDKIWYF